MAGKDGNYLSFDMRNIVGLIFSAGLLSLFLSSCEKEQSDYTLELYVTVEDTIQAQNVLVHLYAPVENTNLDFFIYTDENGRADLKLKNKAVLEIVASKAGYKGCTFAEIDRNGTKVFLDMKFYTNENNGCRGNQ